MSGLGDDLVSFSRPVRTDLQRTRPERTSVANKFFSIPSGPSWYSGKWYLCKSFSSLPPVSCFNCLKVLCLTDWLTDWCMCSQQVVVAELLRVCRRQVWSVVVLVVSGDWWWWLGSDVFIGGSKYKYQDKPPEQSPACCGRPCQSREQ